MSRGPSVAIIVVALGGAACHPGQPLVETTPGKDLAPGTITGVARWPGDREEWVSYHALPGRRVHAVHIGTGRRYSAVTEMTGRFSIRVPLGKYRLEIEQLDGTVVQQETIDINQEHLHRYLEVFGE